MLHPQLPDLQVALDDTERRAHALAALAGHDRWMQAPAPGRWSPSQCVQHLVRTIDAFLPIVDDAFERAARPPAAPAAPYRPDLIGRLLLWMLEPPYRIRTATPAPFVPDEARPAAIDLAEFVARHEAWRRRLRRADGYPLETMRIASPFVRRTSYSLYSTFCIVPTHERRHLWQGEQALAASAHRR